MGNSTALSEQVKTAMAQAGPGALPVPKDEAIPVLPVPTNAPDAESAAKAMMRGCKPDGFWSYRDASGALLFCLGRWNKPDGEKDIRPLTWVREADGKEHWAFKHLRAPRPLYGLDHLAKRPQASIIIVEGEQCAEAARTVFPRSVVLTWPGGSNAVSKANWAPLVGAERVMLWPDNDDPGAKAASQIAKVLAGLGIGNISVVDAAALASQTHSSVHRDAPKGWDVADAIDEGWAVDALRKAAVGLAKVFDPGPAYVSHGPFDMRAAGLFCTVRAKGKDADDEEIRLSGPFEIPGRARDAHGGQWARVLRWKDGDGREHTASVNDADLHGEASALAAKLAHGGLQIATARGSRERLVAYINGAFVHKNFTTVERTGWHDVAGKAVYVLPAQSIGAPASETVRLQSGATAAYGAKGTLAGWREAIGERAGSHSRAVLALSVAFAGPLLHLTGQDGFGVNLFGSSSRGKTTLLQVAASVWGGPSFLRAWRSTGNALEASAALASDTLLPLDEIGAVDARDAGAAIYALFNGQGKGRAGRDGNLREPKSWRIVALSSGEMPMSAKVAEGGKRAMAGQSVRMLDIQADAGHGFGCFDHGDEDGDAGPISNAFKEAVRGTYGTAGPAYVQRVVADGVAEVADDCKAAVAAFVEKELRPGADGQVSRVAARLGLIGVAGELATTYGLTGWQTGAAMNAARQALAEWIEARGGVEPSETTTAISAVRKFIENNGDARFELVAGTVDNRVVINRAGYRKGVGSDQEWWCLPEVWKSDICAGLDPVGVAKALAGCGMLRRQANKLQCKVRIGDRTFWAYVLTASIIDGAGDAE